MIKSKIKIAGNVRKHVFRKPPIKPVQKLENKCSGSLELIVLKIAIKTAKDT